MLTTPLGENLKLAPTHRKTEVSDRSKRKNLKRFRCGKFAHFKSKCRMKDQDRTSNNIEMNYSWKSKWNPCFLNNNKSLASSRTVTKAPGKPEKLSYVVTREWRRFRCNNCTQWSIRKRDSEYTPLQDDRTN